MASWNDIAAAKRQSILDSIPPKWRMSGVPSNEQQKDVTGQYIHQFLTEDEVLITETDAVGIVNHISSGKWKATNVTEAFCHRASLAHQLVSSGYLSLLEADADCDRQSACMKHSLMQPFPMPSTLMITWPRMADPLVLFMAFPSA